MAQFELVMPKMGESVAEATIIKWLKKPGDSIELDEPVLEIATDKVDSEIPSPVAGILEKILFEEGQTIQVNGTIAIIKTQGADNAVAAAPTVTPVPTASVSVSSPAQPVTSVTSDVPRSQGDRFYSPLVRNIAKQEGISMDVLATLEGSGKDGRLTKEDLLKHIANKGTKAPAPAPLAAQTPTVVPAPTPRAEITPPAISVSGSDEIIEMDRMRKLIADHMVMSKAVSPHVTSMVEVDVTNMVLWRERVKKEFEKREGEKITFTPIILEAVARAIKDYPMINVSVNGTQIIKRKNINIGMATALPSGNLIVPVIKNADLLSLTGLTKSVNDLANRARNNKLTPDDIANGTFTVTNVGSFGNVMGTPIINQPQVAIMAAGVIKKKPAVIETPQGDVIAIRHMMFCSLSYDHRVVDGALGGSFLRRVADYLEAFDLNRNI
ncbi:MAG: dihydrolipoamide acetyltransferase family protein [Bacteroidia bacterium]